MWILKLKRLLAEYIPTAMASQIEELEYQVACLEDRVGFLRRELHDIAYSNRSDEEDLASWACSALQKDDENERN
jgi:hypothetical protein